VRKAARVGLRVITTILTLCAWSRLAAPPLVSSSSCPLSATVATGFHNGAQTRGDSSALLSNHAVAFERVEGWDAKGAPDLYGNEVSNAVARYKLDDTGGLYEVHSPQTELPRLASPVS
jgi:hypothetical protein